MYEDFHWPGKQSVIIEKTQKKTKNYTQKLWYENCISKIHGKYMDNHMES